MSTILNTNGEARELPVPEKKNARFAVFTADWNPDVTHALRDGAVDTLRKAGVEPANIDSYKVAGTVELVNAAALTVNSGSYDAVIVIGCVIRGDTPHFDYVCMQASVGVAQINALGKAPVIFGVLTVDTLEQALDRAGGRLGNKGSEAAVAAIEMANLHNRF